MVVFHSKLLVYQRGSKTGEKDYEKNDQMSSVGRSVGLSGQRPGSEDAVEIHQYSVLTSIFSPAMALRFLKMPNGYKIITLWLSCGFESKPIY